MKKSLLFSILALILLTGFLFTSVQADNEIVGDIKTATIVNAYWVGDYQVPDIAPRRANSFLVVIQFPVDCPKSEQIQNFVMKAGNQFRLKAKRGKALQVVGYDIAKYQINDKLVWSFWFYIDSKKPVTLKPGQLYRLIPQKSDHQYHWIIPKQISLLNIREVKFSNSKDPVAAILAQGKPIDSNDASVIPFSFENQLIGIDVHINNTGKKYRFIVDTGASATVIDNRVAAELMLEKKSEGNVSDGQSRSKDVDVVLLKRLIVGDVGVENCGAMVMDLKNLFETHVDGVIGCNFLRFFNMKIDYEQQKLTLDPQNIPVPATAIKTKLHFLPDGNIGTNLKMGGNSFEALIDTGMGGGKSSLGIPNKLFSQISSICICKPRKFKGVFAEYLLSQSDGMISRVDSIQIGDYTIKNPMVTFQELKYVNMGDGFLSNFNIIFNFPAMEMALTPISGRQWDTNSYSYGFGIQKKENDGIICVTGVFEGSPADLAGLKSGDEVEKIYGNNGPEMSYIDLINLMGTNDNQTIKLLIKNQDGEREVILNKAELL